MLRLIILPATGIKLVNDVIKNCIIFDSIELILLTCFNNLQYSVVIDIDSL